MEPDKHAHHLQPDNCLPIGHSNHISPNHGHTEPDKQPHHLQPDHYCDPDL